MCIDEGVIFGLSETELLIYSFSFLLFVFLLIFNATAGDDKKFKKYKILVNAILIILIIFSLVLIPPYGTAGC